MPSGSVGHGLFGELLGWFVRGASFGLAGWETSDGKDDASQLAEDLGRVFPGDPEEEPDEEDDDKP